MRKNQRPIRLVIVILMLVVCMGTTFANTKVMIQGVPLLNQYPELPTGCEATALTMLLNYHGVSVTKQEVANAMPKAAVPYYYKGKMYGESPNKAFLGNPYSKNAYGVYAPVIIQMVESYLPGRADDLGGGSFDKVYQALDEGRPVMIWTTIGMLEAEETARWTTPGGETVIWKVPEHAVVAVGYDDTYIYINDPYTGTLRKYPDNLVIDRWNKMGKQAVAIKPTNAYPQCVEKEKKDALIDGILYKNLLRVDEHGTWIQATVLDDLHGRTNVVYDMDLKNVVVTVTEDYPLPKTSKWLSTNSEGKQEAIPENINGKYYIQIQLSQMEKEIITYNPKGKKVMMEYKIVDGKSYVSMEWVEAFYDINIIEK